MARAVIVDDCYYCVSLLIAVNPEIRENVEAKQTYRSQLSRYTHSCDAINGGGTPDEQTYYNDCFGHHRDVGAGR